MKEMTTRVCARCGRELPIDEFDRRALGHRLVCKECAAAIRQEKEMKIDMLDELLKYGSYDSLLDLAQKKKAELSSYEPRELLEEIKKRGYKWTGMTHSVTIVNVVDYDKI